MEGNNPGYDAPLETTIRGIRTELIGSYEMPRYFYSTIPKISPVRRASEVGLLLWYGLKCGCMTRRKRTEVNVDGLVEKWADVLTGLAVAHDKETADRYDAAI